MTEYSQEQRFIDYRLLFAEERGQRVLEDLMEFCGFLRPVHFPGDHIETAINEGKRNVFLYIMANCHPALAEQWAKIRRENLKYG